MTDFEFPQENSAPRVPTPDFTTDDIAKGLHLPKQKKVRRRKYKTDRILIPEHRQSAPKKPVPALAKRKRPNKPGEFRMKGGKVQMNEDGLSIICRLTGTQFYNPDNTSRRRLLKDCTPKTPISIAREPANPYDGNAVAVYESSGGHQIGYFPKKLARVVAPHIDAGTFEEPQAKIEKMLGTPSEPGARIRVDFVVTGKRSQ